MPSDIQEQWAGIRVIQADLEKLIADREDKAIYLMSVKRRKPETVAGRMSVATTYTAAMMIFQETHRVAEPAEVAAWKREQLTKGQQLKQQQAQKDAKVSVDLGPLVNRLVQQAGQEAGQHMPPASNDQTSKSGHTSRPA